MQNILEVKNKVMKEKIQKQIDIIQICYIGENEEEKNALLKIMQIIQNKYEQSFNRIINNVHINKSLKYKELEKIVMNGLNKIEIEMAKNTNKHKDKIEKFIKEKYEKTIEIEDIDKRLEEIQKARDVYSYFNHYLGQEKLEEYYLENKFEVLIEKSKIDFFAQKEDFNAFHQMEGTEELEKMQKYYRKELSVISEELINSYKAKKQNMQKRKAIKRIKNFVQVEEKKTKWTKNSEKNILLEDELLGNYLIESGKKFPALNRNYLCYLPIFDLQELRLTKEQENEDKSSANLKIIYAYLKQMAKDRMYSMEEIEKILGRFNLYDEENIKLLCKVQKLEKFLETLLSKEDIKREYIIKNYRYFKVDQKTITGNLVKLRLTQNSYEKIPSEPEISRIHHLTTQEFAEYINLENIKTTLIKGMEQEKTYEILSKETGEKYSGNIPSRERYNNEISSELKELEIWNELIDIDEEKREYTIVVSLDDFEGLPIDESKLEKVDDRDLKLKYFDAKIEELKNLIEYCIPEENNEQQKTNFKIELDFIKRIISGKFILYKKAGVDLTSAEFITKLNNLYKEVINYIEKLDIFSILSYGEQKIMEIDRNDSFELNMKELGRINTINRYIKTEANNIFFKATYLNKKFELLLKELVSKEWQMSYNPNKEELLQKYLYPYCTKEEQKKFMREFEQVIEEEIIPYYRARTIESKLKHLDSDNFGELHRISQEIVREIEEKEYYTRPIIGKLNLDVYEKELEF